VQHTQYAYIHTHHRLANGSLQNPGSAASLVQSALEHCSVMNEELDVLKASLPKPPPKYVLVCVCGWVGVSTCQVCMQRCVFICWYV